MKSLLRMFAFFLLTIVTPVYGHSYEHINQVLGDAGLEGVNWEDLKKLVGIRRCQLKSPPDTNYKLKEISPDESGVVVDAGRRTLFEVSFNKIVFKSNKKSGQVSLRFTFDRVLLKDGEFCGFELFIKSEESPQAPAGYALNFDGKLLAKVPKELAFDKAKLKNDGDEIVEDGLGCYSCHPSVSYSYGMPDASNFWRRDQKQGDATRVIEGLDKFKDYISSSTDETKLDPFRFNICPEGNWSSEHAANYLIAKHLGFNNELYEYTRNKPKNNSYRLITGLKSQLITRTRHCNLGTCSPWHINELSSKEKGDPLIEIRAKASVTENASADEDQKIEILEGPFVDLRVSYHPYSNGIPFGRKTYCRFKSDEPGFPAYGGRYTIGDVHRGTFQFKLPCYRYDYKEPHLELDFNGSVHENCAYFKHTSFESNEGDYKTEFEVVLRTL